MIFGDAETAIAETIKREGVQLPVIDAYGHSPIPHFILGRTTTTMVRIPGLPVLLFR